MFLKTRRMNQINCSQIVLRAQVHVRRSAKAQSQLTDCTAWNPGQLQLTLTRPVSGFRKFCGEFLLSVCGCCIAGPEVVRSDMATVFHSVSAIISCVHRHHFISIKSESCRPGRPSGYHAVETQHSSLVLIVTTNLSSVNHLGNPRPCPQPDSSIFALPICLSFCFKTDAGGVGTQGHTWPGSGSVLAPDLSWLLFCELSSI